MLYVCDMEGGGTALPVLVYDRVCAAPGGRVGAARKDG
jgi:hypothetical protein